jgi:hypothetical protein
MVVEDRHVLGGIADGRPVLVAPHGGIERGAAIGRGATGHDRHHLALERKRAANELRGSRAEGLEPRNRLALGAGTRRSVSQQARHPLPHRAFRHAVPMGGERLKEQALRALLADEPRIDRRRDGP